MVASQSTRKRRRKRWQPLASSSVVAVSLIAILSATTTLTEGHTVVEASQLPSLSSSSSSSSSIQSIKESFTLTSNTNDISSHNKHNYYYNNFDTSAIYYENHNEHVPGVIMYNQPPHHQHTTKRRQLQEEFETIEDDETDTDNEDLAVVVSFEDILKLTIFLAVAWIMSNLSVRLGLPGLVGEIITGFLLGPPLADFCPFPEAMVLIGNFGLLGLMLESGIYLDIAQLSETGTRAVLMAVSGTILALASGTGLGFFPLDSGKSLSAAMSVGAAFSPSSLGVAAAVLSAGEVLNTPIGQLIVASSVVDDVLGLILLAILNVFVMEDPSTFNYIQPFLASFGWLLVLGYLGIKWIPRLLQNVLLPRVPPPHRDKATFAFMFLLMMIYLPLLNYSGASYLTGAFLAGLSVSQLPTIHKAYAHSGRELMVWLMRLFFSATIGFQVPILKYNDPVVLGRAAKYLIPIVAKVPLGLLVPRLQKEPLPSDFPFDPYWRDVWITSLSVMCRGEFNFVVASFGLSEGLLDAETYSAIVLAVLISSIMGPLLLSSIIRYYNRLSEKYISQPHLVNRIDKSSNDGYRPLFVAIQIRTPTTWGLHERFQHALQDLGGLLVLDHRTFHSSNGLEAVAMTELFLRDVNHNVKVKEAFKSQENGDVLDKSDERTETNSSSDGDRVLALSDSDPDLQQFDQQKASFENNSSGVDSSRASSSTMHPELGLCGKRRIQERLDAIQEALEACMEGIDKSKYAIRTTQWEPFLQGVGEGHHRQRTYTFTGFDGEENPDQEGHGEKAPLNQIFDGLSVDLGFDLPTSPVTVPEEYRSTIGDIQMEQYMHHPTRPETPLSIEEPLLETAEDNTEEATDAAPEPTAPSPLLKFTQAWTEDNAGPPSLGAPPLPRIPRPTPMHSRNKSLGDRVQFGSPTIPIVPPGIARPSALRHRATTTGQQRIRAANHGQKKDAVSRPPPTTVGLSRPPRLRGRSVSLGQAPAISASASGSTASSGHFRTHRRRPSHNGSHTSQLSFDLWSNDQVAHECVVRRDSYIVPPTVAGQSGESADEAFLALARATTEDLDGSVAYDEESGLASPLAGNTNTTASSPGHRHRLGSFQEPPEIAEQVTEAIHHRLQGFCRHKAL